MVVQLHHSECRINGFKMNTRSMGGPFQVLDHHIDDALEHETKHSLNEKALADIITLCQERGLDIQGEKPALIQVLLDWKSKKPIPAPSTPRLVPSDEHGPKVRGVPDITFLLGDDKSEIKYEDLVTEHKLGAGGFKDCYAGKYKGEPVAIGELRVVNFTDADLKEMKHEINVLKQLRHENVVQFIGVCSNASHLCIITELCENGDLFDYMRKVPKPTFIQQVMFMHDISLGVTYLHNRRPSIIHRDLKSMNILISKNLQAKINDFGLARIRPRANASAHTHCGTPNWQAPEFWSPIPSYTEKVDVYACALIFWEIMTWGEAGFPYQNYTEHQLYVDVRDNNVRPPTDRLKNYPTPLLQLIESMWKKDPKSRPSMGNVNESLNQYLT